MDNKQKNLKIMPPANKSAEQSQPLDPTLSRPWHAEILEMNPELIHGRLNHLEAQGYEILHMGIVGDEDIGPKFLIVGCCGQ